MLFLFVLFFCSQCLSGLFFEKNLVFLLLYSANTMLVGKLFLYFSPPPPPPFFFFFFFFFFGQVYVYNYYVDGYDDDYYVDYNFSIKVTSALSTGVVSHVPENPPGAR